MNMKIFFVALIVAANIGNFTHAVGAEPVIAISSNVGDGDSGDGGGDSGGGAGDGGGDGGGSSDSAGAGG